MVAKFVVDPAFDSLILSMEQVAQLPKATRRKILDVGAELIVRAYKASLTAIIVRNTGQLVSSITATWQDKVKGGSYLISPTGKRSVYKRALQIKTYARSRSHRTYTVGGKEAAFTNMHLAQILESGSAEGGSGKRKIAPRRWKTKADESMHDEVLAAQYEVWDSWLESHGL